MPDKQIAFVFLLLERVSRARVDAVWLFASAAYQVICCKFSDRLYAVVARVIEETAFEVTFFAFASGADIEIDK